MQFLGVMVLARVRMWRPSSSLSVSLTGLRGRCGEVRCRLGRQDVNSGRWACTSAVAFTVHVRRRRGVDAGDVRRRIVLNFKGRKLLNAILVVDPASAVAIEAAVSIVGDVFGGSGQSQIAVMKASEGRR